MNEKEIQLIKILQKEVAPALGCTGPTSVAFAAAKAHSIIKGTVQKVKVIMDRDTYKNSISVGIPRTQYKGLDVAAAIGAIGGNAEKNLEVLDDLTKEDESLALQKIKQGDITVEIAWEREGMGLYIDAYVYTENGCGRAIICGTHTNIGYLQRNQEVVFNALEETRSNVYQLDAPINAFVIDDFINFAKTVDIENLPMIKDAIRLNGALANFGIEKRSGSGFGVGWSKLDQNNVVYKARAATAAAGDARMSGGNLPAMSCASSGNVGITASVPIKVFGDFYQCTEEEIVRAVALSYLVTIYAKMHIGRLSPVCACSIAASLGVAAGCGLLKQLSNIQIGRAISNVIGAIGGTLCDGAKNGCAIKLSTAIGIAIENVLLVEHDAYISDDEGLVGQNADESLALLGKIAREGMVQADIIMCKEIITRNQARV